MPIVPIRDEYTDTGAVRWRIHTPISLGNGTAVVLTNRGVAPAAIGSDNFADAPDVGIVTDGGQYVSLLTDNTTYGLETNEPGTHWKSAWWKYVPGTSGTVTVDTQLSLGLAASGGSRDTVLFVYTGTALNNLVEVAQDDDAGGGGTSRIASLAVTAGTTYYIRAVSWTVNFGINLVVRVVGPRTASGAIARLYTLTSTGWTRGNPTQLTADVTTSRASAATLDGNVLIQGLVDTEVTALVPATEALGFAYGTGLPEIEEIEAGSTTSVPMAQLVRINAPATITAVTFNLADEAGGVATNARIALCTDPLGTGVVATTGNLTVGAGATTITVALRAALAANTDYYLVVAGADGVFNSARLGGTYSTEHYGPLDPPFAAARFFNGAAADSTKAIWLRLTYETAPAHTAITTGTATGYTVLGVSGTTITPGTALAISGTAPGTLGLCSSGPDAMARIPLTNRFWAWRSYPDVQQVHLDVLQVVGTTVTLVGTVRLANDGGFTTASTPHGIVPISTTEAISVLSLSDRQRLVHAVVGTDGAITTATQDTAGYPAADGSTLVASVGHQGEVYVKAGPSDPLTLVRFGVDWAGGGFAVTALPVGQLTAAVKPPDYTARTKTAHVSILANSASVAFDGTLVVARPYLDAGSDDNWVLFTQYDQATGAVVANTWSKGDASGDVNDTLHVDGLAVRWDSTAQRLIFAATEPYSRNGGSVIQPNRLASCRVSYTLDQILRSQAEQFER